MNEGFNRQKIKPLGIGFSAVHKENTLPGIGGYILAVYFTNARVIDQYSAIRKATESVLACAEENNLQSIAFPLVNNNKNSRNIGELIISLITTIERHADSSSTAPNVVLYSPEHEFEFAKRIIKKRYARKS